MEISTLIEFNKSIGPEIARLLMGEAGIGKSAIVKMAASIDRARLIKLCLSELEPSDVVGMPYIDQIGDVKVTRFAQPDWWPTDPNEKVYLFLDEVDRCREDMQPIAMQLTLDRRAGGRMLPPNVVIWAACNGENYLTMPIDQALMTRFVTIHLTPSVEEWISWARDEGIHRSVIEFIRSDPSNLDIPENLIGKPNLVVPTRRTWAMLGSILNNLKCDLVQCNLGIESYLNQAIDKNAAKYIPKLQQGNMYKKIGKTRFIEA